MEPFCVSDTSQAGYVEDAASSWWSGPQSVIYDGSIYVTGVSEAGNQIVAVVDGENNIERNVIGDTAGDDHNTPAILVESDVVPLVAWCEHNADNNINVRKGVSVGSVSDLGDAITIDCGGVTTYAQLYREPSTNNVIILTRVASRYWYFVRSTDWGETWGTPTALFDAGADNMGYVWAAQDGSTLRVVMYGHPTSSTLHEIYACTINLTTGAIATLDGSVVDNFLTPTSLPVTMSSLTLAYDPPDGTNVRMFDVSDQWEIGFCEWTTDNDAAYKYLYYDGVDTFTKRDMVATGAVFGYDASVHYHGGMAFPKPAATGGTVYLCRESDGTWYYETWTTADNGQTWSPVVIDSSCRSLVRPVCVIGNGGSVIRRMLYYGTYTAYNGDALVYRP